MDYIILALYGLSLIWHYKRSSFVLMFGLFLCAMFLPDSFYVDGNIVLTLGAISLFYCAASVAMASKKELLQSFAALCMAVYLLLFSLDSWINGNVETWLWLYHEAFVIGLHLFIVMSFSRWFERMVGICAGAITGHHGRYTHDYPLNRDHKKRKAKDEVTQ